MPDAIVVGAGAMGLATARELAHRGLAVTVVERGQPGQQASWASAGIVSDPIGDPREPGYQLESLSRRLWPAFATAVQAESGMDPEFRESGCLIPALDDRESQALVRSFHGGSFVAGKLLQGQELREVEPRLNPSIDVAVWRPGGNVENRRLCRALEISCRQIGVEIRTGTEVRSIASGHDRVTGVMLADEFLAAERVVVASGAWTGGLDGCSPVVPVVPQRGQILALDRGLVALRNVIMALDDPYVVPRADGRIVIGATREMAGWDRSYTAEGVAWLLTTALQIVPDLGSCSINEIWTGFRPLSLDGLPIIGPGALEGLYFVTGHGPSGIGPLPGSIALLAALMFDEQPPVPAEPLNPRRFQ